MDEAVDSWIQCENLSKRFRTKHALNKITIEIKKGVNLLIGKNGSGKSTLISMIEGVSIPSSGTIKVFGLNPVSGYKEITKRISFLPERPNVFNDGKVKDYYEQYDKFNTFDQYALENNKSIFEIDSFWNTKFKNLSLGEMQLATLCAVLSAKKEAFVLDEPNSNLDVEKREKLWNLLEDMSKNGKDMLIVSHIPDRVIDFSDAIFILKNGYLDVSIDQLSYWQSSDNVHVIRCDDPEAMANALDRFNPVLKRGRVEIKAQKLGDILCSLNHETLESVKSISHRVGEMK